MCKYIRYKNINTIDNATHQANIKKFQVTHRNIITKISIVLVFIITILYQKVKQVLIRIK